MQGRVSSPRQVWVTPIYDAVSWAIAILFASFMRYQVASNMTVHWRYVLIGIGVCVISQLLVGAIFIYRHRWRIGSFEEVVTVAAVVVSVGVVLGIVSAVSIRSGVSYGAVVAATLCALVLALGGRATYRLISVATGMRPSNVSKDRAIVFGAGDAGIQVIEALLANETPPFLPVVLLDDDPSKRHLRIRSLSVVGNRDDIGKVAERFNATMLVIAITNVDAVDILEVAERARDAGLEVRILPPLSEMFAGKVRVGDIRSLTVEDLMGRREIDTNVAEIGDYLKDKRVLVTGAGGSIGSELCRQITRFSPASLIMLERDESALHEVQLAIEGRALLDTRNLVVCDIRDAEALNRVFDEHRPDVVFHAAALKHLSLLEMWPAEALKTNVWGSINVLEASHNHGVEIFVNISTDKAADPISVLGYSKRLAERVTASFRNGEFVSVRFGNVLGSRGSFLPTFRKQVSNGGPITVTDPDVTRFFMTISEAVQLTLQAAARGKGGEVLVLEMGQPVRIADVAKQLADEFATPIEIVFTGLRPGEKLHESLFGVGDANPREIHSSITSCSVPPIPAAVCWGIEANASPERVKEALKTLSLTESSPPLQLAYL
jgi:FlaA1/EpsC-like NDP-sugar epimerase